MTSSPWPVGITVAFLSFASILPATVGAQPPAYLTQWGTEGSGDGQLMYPTGVAADVAGDVYVADLNNYRVQKFTATGTYLTQWGSLGSGDGQFGYPIGVATDVAGDVYVVDLNNRRIQKFTGTGVYLTQWGSPPDSMNRLFIAPYAVATDRTGDVYVADFGDHRIQKFTNTGTYLTQWGSFGSGNGEFDSPIGVATDAAGDVYVVEFQNHRIQKFTSTGTYLTQWGSFGSGDGQFANPAGVATDAAGNVFVADFGNHRIQKFTSTGTYLTQWGSFGSGDGQFSTPRGVATDAAGNVYVADQGNHRIQKFGPESIAMAFDFTPNTLNLSAQSLWVTGLLEPASPFAASGIDIASIRLNGTVPVDPATPTALGDHNGNGVPDLMVKFSRAAVELTVSEGDNVAVTATGMVDGRAFSGTDYIRVRRARVSPPLAGSHVTAGSVTQVGWQMPSGIMVESIALLFSPDAGSTWNLIAQGQPNTGSYNWTVPNVPTDQAKVAVVLVESVDASGDNVDGVLGVSETFSIEAVVGVGDRGPAALALAIRGATPNPAAGDRLWVEFTLRDGSLARLELMDVAGRVLTSRQVGALGPGTHALSLSDGVALRPGIYFLRLTQGGSEVRARAAVVK